MPIDSATVGSNQRLIQILGDPTTAANQQNVAAAAGDAKNMAGLFAALQVALPVLLNSAGTFDLQRSAVGTTGIAAINSEGVKRTYSAAIIDFVPVATATDFFNIVGGANVIRVLRVAISGFATVAISSNVQLVKRTAANTAGTLAVQSATPHDSNDVAAVAVVNTYTVNPTGLGAGINVRAAKLNQGVTGAAGSIVWDFSTRNSRAIVLRGATQSLALNWNGAAIPAGTLLDIEIEWSEE